MFAWIRSEMSFMPPKMCRVETTRLGKFGVTVLSRGMRVRIALETGPGSRRVSGVDADWRTDGGWDGNAGGRRNGNAETWTWEKRATRSEKPRGTLVEEDAKPWPATCKYWKNNTSYVRTRLRLSPRLRTRQNRTVLHRHKVRCCPQEFRTFSCADR